MRLAALLEATDDIEVVGQAEDGRDAVEQCRVLRPDVVLMDVRMPRMDGIAATRMLAAEGSEARVLMLTKLGLRDRAQAVVAAYESGLVVPGRTAP